MLNETNFTSANENLEKDLAVKKGLDQGEQKDEKTDVVAEESDQRTGLFIEHGTDAVKLQTEVENEIEERLKDPTRRMEQP